MDNPKSTNTKLNNIIESDNENKKAVALLKKCKANDKGKKEFKADSKTWFLCRNKDKAEKTIREYKKHRDNFLKS